MKIEQISYNEETDRLECGGTGIHCGDCLEVLLPSEDGSITWQEVSFEARFEIDGAARWYMPGKKGISPIGLFARKN